MLKLKQGVIPTWTIDGVNKEFKVEEIIGAIQSIYVDWNLVTGYSIDALTITLDVAPVSSILVNFFYREVSAIEWNWQVTLWDLKTGFYRKIGRVNNNLTVPANIAKLYPEDYVKSELRKSLKRITNKSPEKKRVQQYTLRASNWYIVTGEISDNSITFEQSLTQEITWMFFVWDGVSYEYYGLDWTTFEVAEVDLSELWDRVIVWYRIPYGVKNISTVHCDGRELTPKDERYWGMYERNTYTVTKDFQWNEYLFTPYSEDVETIVVKYIPDLWCISDDNDIVDIPEEYADVVIYDTAYKLLKDKEDDRAQWIKDDLWNGRWTGMLYDYQSYIKSQIKKTKNRIWFAKTNK